MEKLITKTITFEKILINFGNNHVNTFNFIMTLKRRYKHTKFRLVDEAREYYAKYYNVEKDEVWYGNLSGKDIPNPFPYSHVIGNLSHITNTDMSKLKYVYGNIFYSDIEEYPNLEKITECGHFYGSKVKRLPKLKYAARLILSNSNIEDIRSLEKVISLLKCENTNIKYINPNLEIMGYLYCKNSNNFEKHLDLSKKHGPWDTDNHNIMDD